ncbi:hypothetical protein C5D04_17065, partial [Rathayibacter sp. AY1D2]
MDGEDRAGPERTGQESADGRGGRRAAALSCPVLILLTLLGSWNDFAWPLIALKDNELFTLPIG